MKRGVVNARGQGTRANPRTYFLPEGIGEIGKFHTHEISFTISPNGEALESEPEASIGETIEEISVKFHPNSPIPMERWLPRMREIVKEIPIL